MRYNIYINDDALTFGTLQVYQVTLELLEEMAHPDKMAPAEIEERKEKLVNLVPLANGE
jgi:hypothetical protein